MLNNPDVIRHWRDCVNGTGGNCTTGTNLNPTDVCNHGTSSAALISGNGALGDQYRGTSTFTIDSYRVYDANCLGDLLATQRGFAAAVAEGAWVVVAEMQWDDSFTGSIAQAAEAAFDAGASVVAANGNYGAASMVRSPAIAHRVLGIGAVNSTTGSTLTSQSRGPTPDGRIKPDIQLPAEPVVTAGNDTDTYLEVGFGSTNAATAWAGGASALLHRWYCDSATKCINPATNTPNPYGGVNYAAMIQSGTRSYPFASSAGAGVTRLMGCYGWDTFGWVTVQSGQDIDIPIYLTAMGGYTPPADWQVGLWWPETASQAHNQVRLYLISPAGETVASSTHSTSVFQRANRAGTLAHGIYTLRIRGYSINTASQKVFYSSRARQSTGCQ